MVVVGYNTFQEEVYFEVNINGNISLECEIIYMLPVEYEEGAEDSYFFRLIEAIEFQAVSAPKESSVLQRNMWIAVDLPNEDMNLSSFISWISFNRTTPRVLEFQG